MHAATRKTADFIATAVAIFGSSNKYEIAVFDLRKFRDSFDDASAPFRESRAPSWRR